MPPSKDKRPSPAPRVLVRLTGTLGDALVSLPALRAARAHFGNQAEFHLLHDDHPERTPVTEFFLAEPFFAHTLAYPKTLRGLARLRKFAALAKQLRSQHYAAAVLITSCTLSRWTVRAERRFLRAGGITQFIGFADPATEMFFPRDAAGRALETERDLFWRLRRLQAEGIAVEKFVPKAKPFFRPDAKALAQADAWLREHKLQKSGFWAIAPFTGTPAKDWPPEYWSELLAALGKKSPLPMVILGSPSQRTEAESLAANWPAPTHNTCGELSLGIALGALSRAHGFIGLDALPAHAAGAMGVPGVVIFNSPSHPGQWPPWSPDGQLIVLRPDGEWPDLKITTRPTPGDPRLTNLQPARVLAALDKIGNVVTRTNEAKAGMVTVTSSARRRRCGS